MELFRFLKENLNPQQLVAVEIAGVESQQEQQTRWKRMSKSPFRGKYKSARIPCRAESESQELKEKRGFRVKKSFTFQHDGQGHDSMANNFQKESEILCSIQADSATKNNQSEVKVIYRIDNGATWLRTPKDKIMTSLIKNVILRKWKNVANIVLRPRTWNPFCRPL